MMKALKHLFNTTRPHFESGGRLEKLHPLFDAIETVAFRKGFTYALLAKPDAWSPTRLW